MTACSIPAPADPTLDEAVARIADLAGRIWAVRLAHHPVRSRGLLRSGVRCEGCRQPHPCATLRACG